MVDKRIEKCLCDIMHNSEGATRDLQKVRAVLKDVCKELKQTLQREDFTDGLIAYLIYDCLVLAGRRMEDYDWEEMKAEQLWTIWGIADKSKDLRKAVSWADRSDNEDILNLLKELEHERSMIYTNDSLGHIDGMAFRIINWMTARNTLIQAYRNRHLNHN
jgi:hypothetical protein